MANVAGETAPAIVPFGRGDYFNGCDPRKVTTIVKLPADLAERFVDVLDARDEAGQVDSRVLHERITPIGSAIGEALRDKLAEIQPGPLCRKGSWKNCGVGIGSGFDSFAYQTDEGEIKADIPAHVTCDTALINRVPSNEAAAAPVAVENASPFLQFDLGCFAQMTAAAELAGQLMLEKLQELETARADQALA